MATALDLDYRDRQDSPPPGYLIVRDSDSILASICLPFT